MFARREAELPIGAPFRMIACKKYQIHRKSPVFRNTGLKVGLVELLTSQQALRITRLATVNAQSHHFERSWGLSDLDRFIQIARFIDACRKLPKCELNFSLASQIYISPNRMRSKPNWKLNVMIFSIWKLSSLMVGLSEFLTSSVVATFAGDVMTPLVISYLAIPYLTKGTWCFADTFGKALFCLKSDFKWMLGG